MNRPPYTWHPEDRKRPKLPDDFLHDMPRPSIVSALELVAIAWAFIIVLVFVV